MNFPNTLSLLRILLAPVFAYLFLSGEPVLIMISFFVFTAAALTDWYDGWYARKYGFKTRWGQFLDPLADKILTSAALVCFYIINIRQPEFFGTHEVIPIAALVGIIIFRDIALTVARSVSELKGKEFNTSMISKTKTFVQMTYIFIIIGFMAVMTSYPASAAGKATGMFLYSDWNYYFLALITALTVASGIAYIFESGSKKTVNETT